MRITEFLEEASSVKYRRIAELVVISGVANATLLAIINNAAEMVAASDVQSLYFLLYVAAYLVFLWSLHRSLIQANVAIQEAIDNVRIRIADKLRRVDLSFIERTGRGDLFTRLNEDSNLLSQAVPLLTGAAQSALLVIVSLFYLAFISLISFAFTTAFIAVCVSVFLRNAKKAAAGLEAARKTEAEFFDSQMHLLDGFKELKINGQKSDDLFNHIQQTSEDAKHIKIEVGTHEVTAWSFVRLAMYALLPILVFVIPNYHTEYAAEIYKVTATVLFIIGPINFVANVLPMMGRLNKSLENLQNLENEIDDAISETEWVTEETPEFELPDFAELRLERAVFSYNGSDGDSFTVGPIDLTIPKGELLFIVGGNGSGKSTLLKLLAGLYYPQRGYLYCGDNILNHTNYSRYRELFSIIFTDFHLFDRLYGLRSVEDWVVGDWIEKMQLDKKVKCRDGRFTSLDLSTGQKKRLAFVAAMLEDKPVLIFDELAADQDPQFRQYFYETLLQELKDQGKTIIAVTHDDKYFHVADRVVKMDAGQFEEISRNTTG